MKFRTVSPTLSIARATAPRDTSAIETIGAIGPTKNEVRLQLTEIDSPLETISKQFVQGWAIKIDGAERRRWGSCMTREVLNERSL